jgi:hypothetical protein
MRDPLGRGAVALTNPEHQTLEMPVHQPANPESVFTYGAPQSKFGAGAADEIGLRAAVEDGIAGIFGRSVHLW